VPSQQLEVITQMLRSRPVADTLDVEASRRGMEAVMSMAPVPEGTKSTPVKADGVPCEWIWAPEASEGRTILYLHGGGYVLGSINTHRALVARISGAAGARALAVDYRLAPEHPFPAAVDDATAAYRWLLRQGVDPSSVVIAGDSAGGGLTMATLVALRDARDPLPSAGVCISPWVDLEGIGESMTTRADVDPMVKKDGLRQIASLYLGNADPRTPLAAPLYADLTGLPPLLIHVGTAETLLDDSNRLAEKAHAAGIDVDIERWEDMIHVWHAFAPLLPEATQGIARIGEYVSKRLG
jgi:acetyl esterase/lipase